MYKKSLKNICGVFIAMFVFVHGVFAATTNNGCDKEQNDRINPEIALCSTHVYNVGWPKNPSSESNRQLMRDVIALKTTVMTQEMYKQYEYLETMIRRFKMQLEKAVLTTKLQAAGADGAATGGASTGGYSGGSYSSMDRNSYAVIDGATDCNTKFDKLEALQCIQGNLGIVLNALNERKVSEASQQLKKDVEVLKSWMDKDKSISECNYLSGDTAVRKCLTAMRSKVAGAIDDYKRENRQVNKYQDDGK